MVQDRALNLNVEDGDIGVFPGKDAEGFAVVVENDRAHSAAIVHCYGRLA